MAVSRSALPELPGLDRTSGQLCVGRVADLLERQPGGSDDTDPWITNAGAQDIGRPGDRLTTLPHGDECPDERPDHVVAEGIGDDAPGQHVGVARPSKLLQRSDRGGSLTLLAVRREVVLAAEQLPGFVHDRLVEPARPGQDMAT